MGEEKKPRREGKHESVRETHFQRGDVVHGWSWLGPALCAEIGDPLRRDAVRSSSRMHGYTAGSGAETLRTRDVGDR